MSPREPDAAMVDALRSGRRDAFERLYSDYSAPIYNLCARVLSDREEARDLTQEVFITAFGQLTSPGAEPVRKLRPWLYRVAANACYNHLRTRRHLDGGGDAGLENAACGVDEFERAETVTLVEQSLGQLNERYRTALVLKDLQGLPTEEIAEVMEVTRPTADVLVHRARASFKTAFAKLAGDVPAPATLAAVLVPLSLPAALHAMPSLPASLAPTHALPHAAIPHAAGPATAGLLTKIGAALTTKAAVAAAAAAVVIGGGAVAVKETRHAGARSWQGPPGAAWQSAPQKWSKQWARWSLYSNWMRHGWPSGWMSGRWRWNGGGSSWMWSMKNGSKWSWGGGGGMSSSGSSLGSWSMTMSRTGSKGWSSGSSWSGSGSSSKMSGSGSSGSWSGSSKSGSSGSWNGGSSGSGWNSGSSSGSMDGSSGGGW